MMIKVTCEVPDYSDPAQPSIKVHNNWNTKRMVEVEIDGKYYTVDGRDLITAIENCMSSNSLC